MKKGGVKNRLKSDKDAVARRDGFIQRVDRRMVKSGIVANGFGEHGRSDGWNEKLDLSFELLVFGPVESTQGMRSGGREKSIGSEGSARKIFHQFRHCEG
jgi:hypothetical protein